MKKIEVCPSPEVIHLFDLKGKVVVVVDILRATSTMTVALAQGVDGIIPVSSVDECKSYKENGYLTAAERNGAKVDGFDLGNSPYNFLENDFSGKTLVMTTTNGTRAINLSADADEIVIGSFLNLKAVVEHLKTKNCDIVLFCSGWKGHTNLEDTLFAGAIIDELANDFVVDYDMSIIARHLYNKAKEDLHAFVSCSSYCMRMETKGLKKDIEYCLQTNVFDNVPVLVGNVIKNYSVLNYVSANTK
jgi:2-phosphosulfolactate phosphatase